MNALMVSTALAVLLCPMAVQGHEESVSKSDGVIPGFYQLRTGHEVKGMLIAAAQISSISASLYVWVFRSESYHEDQAALWLDRYIVSIDPSEIERVYQKTIEHEDAAEIRRRWRGPILLSALAVYVFNVVDVALHRDSRRVTLELRPSRHASNLVLVRRF